MSNLILTRKAGQSVQVGDSTTLMLREVHAKKVYVSCRDKPAWFGLGEDFDVGDAVVTVVSISKGYVKFAFNADRRVTIMRTELLK